MEIFWKKTIFDVKANVHTLNSQTQVCEYTHTHTHTHMHAYIDRQIDIHTYIHILYNKEYLVFNNLILNIGNNNI